WRVFSEALRALTGALLGLALDGRDDEVLEPGEAAVADALDALRDLELTGAPFDHAGAVAFFERALAAGSVPIAPPGDNGGVRILDAMQARGLACEALFLIGCNADLIPRRPREDPFLPDADRRRLRNHLSVPLPIKSEAIEEEHLLLALLLGSARRRLTLSWQRADEDGRAKVPSLALREVSRLALGAASLGAAEKAALRVKTHPAEAGSDAARRLGLLPPAEARVNIALELRSPRLFLESLPAPPPAGGEEREERLRAGLSNLRVIEEDDAPTGPDLRYDAFIGESIPPSGPWSPSRLEALGACPQHYFFRHLLRVEELQEPAEGYEIDPLDLGRVVHAVLQEVYEGLQAAGHLRGDGIDPEGAVRAAQVSVARIWGEKTGRLAARMRPRYPLLFEATSAHWIEALRRFLAEDVARLVRDGARLVGLEKEASASLPLGAAGRPLSLAGRFDRVVRLAAGDLVVSDYKSSRRLREMVDLADILKGSRLQMPLYILLAEAGLPEWGAAGARVRAEVLGVGPAVDPEESRFEVDAEKFARHREGFGETLTVLLDLAATGFYPLNEESRVCGYCPYTRACRRGHAATLERLAAAPGGGDYARLRRKSTRAPTLAEVRGRRIPDAGPEEARGRRPAGRPREGR
ncbi:MAG TPA: PD-(D/E)XK nuclease family protein, partial [Candidatus Polarisedimenticolia bacterium]|nr:PD-(D/E)XK nuclease family protein [Candidatus Polarisedimenticolia bacterium]